MTAAILYVAYVIGKLILSGRTPKLKCATCKNCGKLFDDGVLCRFKGRETFKNLTHISNCIDHERR